MCVCVIDANRTDNLLIQPCSAKGVCLCASDTEPLSRAKLDGGGVEWSGVPTYTEHNNKITEHSSHDPSADPAADLAVTDSVFHSLSTSAAFNFIQVTKYEDFLRTQCHLLKPCNNRLMWMWPLSTDSD